MLMVSVNLSVMKDKYCTGNRYGTGVKLSHVKIFANPSNPVISSVYRSDKRICYRYREQR